MLDFLEATLRGYTYLQPMVADGSEKLTLEALKSSRPPAPAVPNGPAAETTKTG